jgi:hypothetical protein
MARPIDYRSPLPFPAAPTAAAMGDADYLRARLEKLGGPGAALLEHTRDGAAVRYKLRQGLEAELLPPVVQSMVGGNLVLERTETIEPDGNGFRGTVDVFVPKIPVPVTAGGTMTLRDDVEGSQFAVRAQVSVGVPLVGGRIEKVVAEQVGRLMAAETEFLRHWLETHPPAS